MSGVGKAVEKELRRDGGWASARRVLHSLAWRKEKGTEFVRLTKIQLKYHLQWGVTGNC